MKAGGIWPKLCKALSCQSSLFFLYCSSMANLKKKKKKKFSFKSPFFHHMVKIYLKDRLVSSKSSWVATCPSEPPVADRRMRRRDTWENRQYLPQGRMKSSCSLNANSFPSTRTPFLTQVYIFQTHTGHFHLKLEMQMANIAVFLSKGRCMHSTCPPWPGMAQSS